MSDQCRNCEARGNVSQCNDFECSIHDYWYTRHLKERIAELEALVTELVKRGNDLIATSGKPTYWKQAVVNWKAAQAKAEEVE